MAQIFKFTLLGNGRIYTPGRQKMNSRGVIKYRMTNEPPPHCNATLPIEVICTEILRHTPDAWEWLFVCRSTNASITLLLRQYAESIVSRVLRDNTPQLLPQRSTILILRNGEISWATLLVNSRGGISITMVNRPAATGCDGPVTHAKSIGQLRDKLLARSSDAKREVLIYYPVDAIDQILGAAEYAPSCPAIARYAGKIYAGAVAALVP